MSTKLEIVNAALLETGNGARQAEDDGSCENLISNANWDMLVAAELEAFHYSFARKSKYLHEKVQGDFGFQAGFLLPGDALQVRGLFIEADEHRCPCDGDPMIPRVSWEQVGQIIYLNDCILRRRKSCPDDKAGVWAEFTSCDIDPQHWSPNFRLGMKYRLAAVFARGINEESGEGDRYEALADRHFTAARKRSALQRGSERLHRRRGRLVSAHMGIAHGPR